MLQPARKKMGRLAEDIVMPATQMGLAIGLGMGVMAPIRHISRDAYKLVVRALYTAAGDVEKNADDNNALHGAVVITMRESTRRAVNVSDAFVNLIGTER